MATIDGILIYFGTTCALGVMFASFELSLSLGKLLPILLVHLKKTLAIRRNHLRLSLRIARNGQRLAPPAETSLPSRATAPERFLSAPASRLRMPRTATGPEARGIEGRS